MSLRGWSPGKEVTGLRGMWSALAQKSAGDPARASYAQNIRFAPGVVRTRPGTVSVPATTPLFGLFAKGLSIGNLGAGWRFFFLIGSKLMYGALTAGGVSCPNPFDYNTRTIPTYPSVGLFGDTLAGTPYSISVALFNKYAYIAVRDKTGKGVAPCLISDGTNVVDVAFSAWTLYRSGLQAGGGIGSMTFTNIGAGRTTPGLTTYALVLQTSTGFLAHPIPQSGSNFASAGTIRAQITVPPGSSIDGTGTVYLLKNRVDNPNEWYWIPNDTISGTTGEVPYQAGTLTFTINLSDADLAASADSANDQWYNVTQSSFPTLSGPFLPSFVVLYGTRMCYGVDNNLYISDEDNPQSLALDRNLVETPKQLRLGYAFPLQGSTDLYMTGAKWLGRVTDNGDSPSTWAPPVLISETIGAPYPGCVCYRTAGNYAWLVTDAGVFLFNGTLGPVPITHLIQDQWARVNWAAAYAIETEDDIENRVLYVAVPIDGATEVNAIFCFDYTQGLGVQEMDISIDLYPVGVYSVAMGPDTQGHNRVWLGADRGDFLMLDEAATSDVGSVGGITTIWESGLVRSPGDFASRMVRVGGMDLWARGGGGLITTLYGPDKIRSVSPMLLSAAGTPAYLTPAPGLMYQMKFDISQIENYSIRFWVNTWLEISGFTVYSKPDLYNR